MGMTRRANQKKTDKNLGYLESLKEMTKGTSSYDKTIEEMLRDNDGAVYWVTTRCVSKYNIPSHEEEDVANIVRSLLAQFFLDWQPERGSLLTFLMVKSLPAVRSTVENGTGYAGAVTQWRRAKRFWKHEHELEAILGRPPTDDEVVEYANAIAYERYGDPKRSAVLLKTEEIVKQRQMFGDKVSLSAPNPAKPDEEIGDSFYEPVSVLSMFESRSFIVSLVERIEDEFGTDYRNLFVARTRLNDGFEEVGTLRSSSDAAKISGVDLATSKRMWLEIVEFVGEEVRKSL